MTRRVGVLGGTFDPIHCGHLDLGRAAERALGLDEILVVASNIPPHRPQPSASSYHRFAMAALAVNGRERWRVSDMELGADGRSFTIDTLVELNERGVASTDLFFVVGADAFADVASWKDYPRLFDRAHFAVVSRPRFPAGDMMRTLPQLTERMVKPSTGGVWEETKIFLIDAATADVSSTAIRSRRAAGASILGLVPPMVQQHIEQHALYLLDPPEARGPGAVNTPRADRLHGEN
jgi:nicotinate-nucleotide adenylyltransferase